VWRAGYEQCAVQRERLAPISSQHGQDQSCYGVAPQNKQVLVLAQVLGTGIVCIKGWTAGTGTSTGTGIV
jgi:hypothetical protein